MEYTREQWIEDARRYGLTQEEAEHYLSASEAEQVKIWEAVRDRAIAKKEHKKPPVKMTGSLEIEEKVGGLLPMSPAEGPPLPKMLNLKWPWKKE